MTRSAYLLRFFVFLATSIVFIVVMHAVLTRSGFHMPLIDVPLAFGAAAAAAFVLLAAFAALDPTAYHSAPPSHTGVLAMILPVLFALPATLGIGLVGVLIVVQWDGESERKFAELGFDWLAIIYCTLTGALMGAAAGALIAFYVGSPLGRGFVQFFAAVDGAVLAIFLMPLLYFGFAVFGAVGILFIVGGLVIGTRRMLYVRGLGDRSRRWSARAALLLGLVGCAVPMGLMQAKLLTGGEPAVAIAIGVVSAVLGGCLGALLGAE